MAKRGTATLAICSTAFVSLGRAQAGALGYPGLTIGAVPHPFGLHSRDEIHGLARKSVDDIVRMVDKATVAGTAPSPLARTNAARIELVDEVAAINRFYREHGWTDGLPIMPPTVERVESMMRYAARAPDDIVACIAPGFGAATVERIAVNAAMAGCEPSHLPVLMAAAEAVAAPEFNIQSIQVTTNPAAVWLIVNGPVAQRLNMNAGINCLGQGNLANAAMGRALRLILQNVGSAAAGAMDRATQGQPGKYLFCCADNEKQSPWEPLHVERGFKAEQSTVTVVGAEGTLNMNTHSKKADELLRVFAETLAHPTSNDYRIGLGDPWVIVGPEHAGILGAAGLSKAEVKRQLWEESKMRASRLTAIDMERMQWERHAELGTVLPDTMIPICSTPGHL